MGAASAAVVPAVDTIYFLPFMVHNVLPLKQLSIFVTTGGAGSSCKAAIWANYNGVNQPLGAPLFVNNTGVATATSTTTVDINVTDGVLDPYTLYWFGAKWTGTLPQIWQYANLTFATAALVGIQGAFNNTTNISFADAYANDMPTFTTASSFVQHGNGAPTVFAVT